MREIMLNSYTEGNYNINVSARFYNRKSGMILEVVSEAKTNNNKCNDENVTADLYLTRGAYSREDKKRLGINSRILIDILHKKLECGEAMAYMYSLLSNAKVLNQVAISLPHRYKSGGPRHEYFLRPYVNTFFPITVTYNDTDVSQFFEEFDCFEPDIVGNVYKAIFSDFDFEKISDEFGNVKKIKKLRTEIKKSECSVAGCKIENETFDEKI